MVSSKVGGLRQDTKVWSQGLVGQKRCALKSSVQSVVWIYMQSCKVLQSAVRCPTRGILTLEREQKWEVKGLVGRCTVVMSTPVSEDLQQANCPGRVTTYKRITHTRIRLYITHILTHSIFLQPGSSNCFQEDGPHSCTCADVWYTVCTLQHVLDGYLHPNYDRQSNQVLWVSSTCKVFLVQRWCREYFGGSNSGARLLVTEANGGELLPKAGPAHPLPPSSALFCSACSNVLLISPPSSNICNGTSPFPPKKL